ncbi:MAG: AMP-binding protein, partial [Burkholderiaceae bacterium]
RGSAAYALATDSDVVLSHADLERACRRVAALLQRHGVAAGDTVSVVMPNGLNTLRVLLGTMWGGRCVNPVNLLAQPEQMRYVIAHSDCKLVVVAPEWEARVSAIVAALDRPVTLIVAGPAALELPGEDAAADMSADPPMPAADALALLMYTSGTTGQPKGVMLTQANLAANARAISTEHALSAEDRVLAVLPLYHINAFAVTMLAPLAQGGSLAMAPKFSAARFWAQAIDHACTWINVVPTIISYLLEGKVPARDTLARIRFCRSASAALPVEHHRAFERKFGIGIIETMGLTETVAPTFSNPLEPARRKIGSVGRASGCEARVIDAQFQPLPDGQRGELAIRGPNVMAGYFKNEEATRASFTPDGWLRTGDLGHRDADGFFFVTGRIKELIIKGGENIAPREIDEALLRHPAVLDAAAVGIPDRHYGQEIMACVVLRLGADCTEEELRTHCLQHLGPYKTPRVFRFVDDLPRGPSGKVQRLKLTQM